MIKTTDLTNLGLALSILGVPFGMYLNFMAPMIDWSPLFMFLSFILTLSYRNFIQLKFPLFNKYFGAIIFFQILMICYGLFSLRMSITFLSFHLYIISYAVALSTIGKKIKFDRLLLTVFIISSISSFFGFYFTSQGYITGELAQTLKESNEVQILDSFTISNAALINFSSGLFCSVKSKRKWFIWILLLIDVYIIIYNGKRTPLLVLVVTFVVFFVSIRKSIKFSIYKKYLIIMSLSLLVTLLSYLQFKQLQIPIDNYSENFYKGVLNILGDTSVRDNYGSAIVRYNLREWAINYIENNFDWYNFIFGAGYMIKVIDNPLLESYVDMGLIGFLIYFIIVILFPLSFIFKKQQLLITFASVNCLYNVLSSLSSGSPYLYIKYTPVMLLIFLVYNNKRYKNEQKRTNCKINQSEII